MKEGRRARRGRRLTGRVPIGTGFLVLASTLVGLLLGEVAVRLIAPQIFPLHPAGLYVEDPDVGYVLTPGFRGELARAEFRHAVRIGTAGLRGGDVRRRQANTFRVLVLGDSQAFGFGVEEAETLSAQLERLLGERFPEADVQVLNGGVPGYGTADQLAFLESHGPALDPDLVVVQFLSVNDLEENLAPARDWAMVTDGMLAHREGDVPQRGPFRRRAQRWLKGHSHLARLGSDVAGYWLSRLGLVGQGGAMWGEDFSPEAADLGVGLLAEIAATASSMDARTLFLYTTGQASVLQREYATLPSRAVVRTAAERAGVPWVDVTARMRQRPNRVALYYPKNGHWTAAGHRVVAEVVAGEIARLGLPRRAGRVSGSS